MAIDLIVHRRNSKGDVVSYNPYKLHVINGIKVFEQPPGHYQYENGDACKPNGDPLDKVVAAQETPMAETPKTNIVHTGAVTVVKGK